MNRKTNRLSRGKRILTEIMKVKRPISATELRTRMRVDYYILAEDLELLKDNGEVRRIPDGSYLKWGITDKGIKFLEEKK